MTDKEKIECLSDLCRFLAIQQDEQAKGINKAIRTKDFSKQLEQLFEIPKIQGSKNITNLQKIGNQKINMENISKAVNYLLGE